MIPKLIASLIAPKGSRAALSILIFHRIFPQQDALNPEEPDAKRFAQILSWLSNSFNVIPLDEALEMLGSNTLPSRAVSITFDDGYQDNFAVALPILSQYKFSATFFIATGFIDGGCMWNDLVAESIRKFDGSRLDLSPIGLEIYDTSDWAQKRSSLTKILATVKYLPITERQLKCSCIADIAGLVPPTNIMMTSQEVRNMHAAGMSIGAHTRTHPILTSLDDETAMKEIGGGKSDLESMLGSKVSLFAYPNGKPFRDYNSTHVEMVRRAGFAAAVSTAVGTSNSGSDLMQLPRFTPWDQSEYLFCIRLLRNINSKVTRV